jgi:hypothetical protein
MSAADGQETGNFKPRSLQHIEYVESYRFSFSEDEFYEQNAEERVRMQFMTDPLWGKS